MWLDLELAERVAIAAHFVDVVLAEVVVQPSIESCFGSAVGSPDSTVVALDVPFFGGFAHGGAFRVLLAGTVPASTAIVT